MSATCDPQISLPASPAAGEPTAIELKQHMIVDKGILSVSPKYAVLQVTGCHCHRHHRHLHLHSLRSSSSLCSPGRRSR